MQIQRWRGEDDELGSGEELSDHADVMARWHLTHLPCPSASTWRWQYGHQLDSVPFRSVPFPFAIPIHHTLLVSMTAALHFKRHFRHYGTSYAQEASGAQSSGSRTNIRNNPFPFPPPAFTPPKNINEQK